MQCLNFEEAIGKIVDSDNRYQFGAYVFVQDALKYTQKMLGRSSGSQPHVGGKELLEGVRGYALESFGPMAMTVLEEWGIHSCDDIGEIVFNMIAHNVASKNDTDSREDFKNGYDFFDAFRKPFLPSGAKTPAPPKSVEVQ